MFPVRPVDSERREESAFHNSPGTWVITPVESTNQSRQVSGTSDASKTQLGLTGSLQLPSPY